MLRYIFERVSDLHNVARKNIMPDDSADGGGNVMFPKIDRTRLGTQSLRGDGGSLDSERRRIKTGADHRSEGGVSR